jgi:hypothetical protein
MYWGDVGTKNMVHIHPPPPHLTFKSTSHNLSLQCLVSSNPLAKVERMVVVAVGVTMATVAMAAVATAAVAVTTAAVVMGDGGSVDSSCGNDDGGSSDGGNR